MGPILRLAYLSPDVLERLLLWREAPSATLLQMIEATYLPWVEQMERVFEEKERRYWLGQVGVLKLRRH